MSELKAQPPASPPSPQGERANNRPPAGQHRVFTELPGLEILEELARSPHGITFKAKRQVEHDLVAVKAFKRALVRKEYIERLARNSETSFLFDHPVLVRGLGCVSDDHRLLLLMEYATGEALARTLKQQLPIKASKALVIVLECVSALQYAAGKGFYHGRLHPGDIMVHGDQIRLIGVGMDERPEAAKTSARPFLFEPLIYTAPEALPSRPFPEDDPARQAVDVYALGAILFHLLTGSPPFRGTTEDALLQERQHLRMPVDWPLTTALPPAACVVTDRMLARNPNLRPSYDTLNVELKEALRAVEWAEKDNARDSQPAHTGSSGSGRRAPVSIVPASTYLPRPANPALFAVHKHPADQGISISTVMLVALIAILGTFIIVKLSTNNPQPVTQSAPVPAPERLSSPPVLNQDNSAPRAVPEAPKAVPVQPAPAVAPTLQEPDLATRQLSMIEDMLHKEEVQPSSALLKVVQRIAEASGKDTPTGIRALVLAADIQDTILRNHTAAATPAQPLVPPPAVKTDSAPTPPAEVAVPEPPAKPAPPPKPDAKELEEQAKAKRALAAGLKAAMALAAKFQYTDLSADLEKLAPDGGSQENQKLAAGYTALAKEELALFQRCHKRLLSEIESSPRKESPLQVRTNSKDPGGDDIVDFDEKGLKIVSSQRGRQANSRIQAWEKIKPLQAYNLLKLLSEENNLEDQVGLLALCFNRGLAEGRNTALENLRNLPNGKGKGDEMAELCKNLDALLALPPGD